MNKVVGLIAAVVIIVIAAVAIAKHGNNNTNNYSNTNNTPAASQKSSSSSNSTSNTPQSTDQVSIVNMSFSPANITVKQGTSVKWTNNDNITHTVNESDGQSGGPNSGDISPGSSYSFTFSNLGVFHYHCSIHPDMLGTVTVTQ